MHGYNFIEWLLGSLCNDYPLAYEYDIMFMWVDWYIPNHDAMGIIIMGGEL